jgi:hypothetical protein
MGSFHDRTRLEPTGHVSPELRLWEQEMPTVVGFISLVPALVRFCP